MESNCGIFIKIGNRCVIVTTEASAVPVSKSVMTASHIVISQGTDRANFAKSLASLIKLSGSGLSFTLMWITHMYIWIYRALGNA